MIIKKVSGVRDGEEGLFEQGDTGYGAPFVKKNI